MPGFGDLAFATPWVLTALVVLPLIWWLLRVTPPVPKQVVFPAVRLLFGLVRDEETPARTPPWLIVLRLAIAALLILALAHPLLNPGERLDGDGPLIVVVDDGWAAAPRWERRQDALADLMDQAERSGRAVILLPTAPAADDGTVAPSGLLRATLARSAARALQPMPWAVDRAAAAAALDRLEIEGRADVLWLSDGIDDGSAAVLAERLQGLGHLRVITDPDLGGVRALLPPRAEPDALRVRVVRAATAGDEALWLRASGEAGEMLAREQVRFAPGESFAEVEIGALAEVRNRIVRIDIEGARGAGAVVLLDERWRRRPVGLVSGSSIEAEQPLLSEMHYLERALSPFSEVRKGDVRGLLQRPLAALVLADVGKVIGDDRAVLERWLDAGGVLIRFAGARLAEGVDDLVPVHLRVGGRALGGAMSWREPAALAPFDADSPFAGIEVPSDVRVRRQVLAEPSLDLATRTWARLVDGTPLVTADRRGRGWLVLVHTTANTAWSDLSLSGLFVDMMKRLTGLGQGVAGDTEEGTLAPLETLDGFGRLTEPPTTSRAIRAADFADASVGPSHPPGFYGAGGSRQALNLTAGIEELRVIAPPPAGVERRFYGDSGEIDLKPWLLTLALALALVDLVAGLALRGLLRGRDGGWATTAAVAIALAASPAWGQQDTDAFALKATLDTRLAYVRTGDPAVDRVSHAGLVGLSAALGLRTSFEPEPPLGINVERHQLIFFPLIYWPVADDQPALTPAALAKIDHYLKTGGIILFDTRDQNAAPTRFADGAGPRARRLRALLAGLDIPPLRPMPPDHVLTRSFYLMHDFPGRWTGGQLWLERHEGGVNDGVSSLIIGGHDWAAAWAVDDRGRPMFAVVPGGERQRELAYRFGVNLAMYALTGNYKADQVHLPAILERLGQ